MKARRVDGVLIPSAVPLRLSASLRFIRFAGSFTQSRRERRGTHIMPAN